MIGMEMMITVQLEKSLAKATMIPSKTAIARASLIRRAAIHRPALVGRGSAAVSLTRATYHACGTTQTRPRRSTWSAAARAVCSSAKSP